MNYWKAIFIVFLVAIASYVVIGRLPTSAEMGKAVSIQKMGVYR